MFKIDGETIIRILIEPRTIKIEGESELDIMKKRLDTILGEPKLKMLNTFGTDLYSEKIEKINYQVTLINPEGTMKKVKEWHYQINHVAIITEECAGIYQMKARDCIMIIYQDINELPLNNIEEFTNKIKEITKI